MCKIEQGAWAPVSVIVMGTHSAGDRRVDTHQNNKCENWENLLDGWEDPTKSLKRHTAVE